MKRSTIEWTAVSDCPTPTVSMKMTSKPAASHSTIVSRVLRATPPSDPAEGEGRMKTSGLLQMLSMAGLVAEDRAAAALRRGVDGQHGQAVAQRGDHVPDGLDEGRLAGSGDSCDADADGFSGVGQTAFDDLLRLGVVGRVGGFDERDGLRKDGDLTGEDSLDIFRRSIAGVSCGV